MSPRLSRALARYTSRQDKSELNALRHELVSFRERMEVAQALSDAGYHRAAALWFAAALRQGGGLRAPVIAYRLGNALRMAGHDRPAARVLDAVCVVRPEWGEPAHSLAWLYRNAGNVEKSADVMERWLNRTPQSERDLKGVAAFVLEMGLVNRAAALLARIPQPTPSLQTERAMLLLQLGRFDEAIKLLEESLARDPVQGGGWLRLAMARKWESTRDSPLEAMQAALNQPGLDDETRAALAFALVKVDDDLGLFEEAWARSVQANTLRKRSAHFDRKAWIAYEMNTYQVFIKDFMEDLSLECDEGLPQPVFVVGMPRSGTTLIERRLGRHSLLRPIGELEVIELLAVEMCGRHNYPHALKSAPAKAFYDTARRWSFLVPGQNKIGQREIDKNPMNYMYLGFISKVFPHSKIIHCRRDPLNTALSLWFQNFAHPRMDYSYDIEDIAWMYGFYRRLMAWWAQVLPKRWLTIDYESLAAQPDSTLRRLVADLGLDWEPKVLESPGESEGAITTASMWQARQPVYTHAINRAHRYERWIGPLRQALQREGIEA